MAYIPNVVGNSTLDADTLNAIGTDIGVGVTVVADNIETLYNYGNVVLANTSMMNTWYSALCNKIVRTRIIDNMYKNRLSVLNKGVLDLGEGIEDILVAPAGVHQQPSTHDGSTNNPYAADLPTLYVKWHVTNAGMVYSVNVSRKKARKAFTSFGALESFVQGLVNSLYAGYEYDCQLLTKFKAAQAALYRIANSNVETVTSPVSGDGTEFLASAREHAELFKWMSTAYNDAEAPVSTRDGNLFMMMTASVEAHVDVKDMAAAFNLEYAQFLGRRLPVDSFTFTDAEKARIMEIAGLDSWPFSEEQETSLGTVLGILCDADLFQVYDTHEPELWENPNGAEASVNYWLHADKIVSISPFANYVVFVAGGDGDALVEVGG